MEKVVADIVVAGQICLDIILGFQEYEGDVSTLIVPGKGVNVGSAIVTTGGAVANTGRALHQLGIATYLIAKIGKDKFGEYILDILQKAGKELIDGMIIVEGEETAFSIVISPPDTDRSFMYNPGANDSLQAREVNISSCRRARFFHFGYPSEMRQMYIEGGGEMQRLFTKVKQQGLTTSLDMAYPDLDTDSGNVDWRVWLEEVLPVVDIFLPSLDEICWMLQQPVGMQMEQKKEGSVDLAFLHQIAGQLLEMGTAIVVLKLGDQGLYLRTTSDRARLEAMGYGKPIAISQWTNVELYESCFKTNVIGTTGAGDCTIAGFLAGMSKALSPEEVLRMATAVGACSVESADAVSGVSHWDEIQKRVEAAWEKHP